MESVFDEDVSDGGMDKKGIWIMARPDSLELDNHSTLTVESADDSAAVSLRAEGITLFAHFLFDVSGSMGYKPDGTSTNDEMMTRLWQAKQAGRAINTWIDDFSDGEAYIGLSTFPNGFTSGNSNVVVPIDRAAVNNGQIAVRFGEQVSGGLKQRNSTPMEAGIVAALSNMQARLNDPEKEPNVVDKPNLRQAILLLSDGAENIGNAMSQLNPLQQAGIRVFTVGYGDPNGTEVNHELLNNLANNTGGEPLVANINDAASIKNAFKMAAAEWLNLRPVVDPLAKIRRGQTNRHTACLGTDAFGAMFQIDWDQHMEGAFQFELVTPKGRRITPASQDVSYHEGGTYALYVIRGNRMHSGQGAGRWR